MKKISTFLALLSCLSAPCIQKISAQTAAPSVFTPLYNTDVIIEPNVSANQRNVRIAAAFNGWLYAAYIVNDSVSHKGGVVVRISKNSGISWAAYNGYAYQGHSFYSACDISVAGSDTNNLSVVVGAARKDLVTKKYEVSVIKYAARLINAASTPLLLQKLDTNKVSDVALASDYSAPAPGDAGNLWSVGLLYAHRGVVNDSIVFVNLRKNGTKVMTRRVVATGTYFQKISLAYSHSITARYGSYCAAWEKKSAPGVTLGNVYYARTKGTIDSVWTAPFCLDSLSPSTAGYVRSPSIAAQATATDNDSSNATIAVSFDRGINGRRDSMDIVGYYNKGGDTTNFWNSFVVAGTTDNEMQSNMSFDKGNTNFLITYYDSTSGALAYANQSMLFSTPNTWTVLRSQYNDNTSNLKAPWPRVVVNPAKGKAVFAWVMDPVNMNGVALTDGEYLIAAVGPEPILSGIRIYSIYPNPSSTGATLPLTSDSPVTVKVSVFNILGENVVPEKSEALGMGAQRIQLDVATLPAGIYFCRVEAGSMKQTLRFIVQH